MTSKSLSDASFSCIAEPQCVLGEGPHWNRKTQSLEWIDIETRCLHSWNFDSGKNRCIALPETCSAVVPREQGGYIGVTHEGYSFIDSATFEMTPIAVAENILGCRFNDGKCDALGRFWAGTLALDATPGKGALFCLDGNRVLKKVMDNLHVSNGIGWNRESSKMYLTDTGKRSIYQFDYNLVEGSISNQQEFVTFNQDTGSPDGLAVDNEGGVWSAIWDGWRIVRFNRDGSLDREITLPIPRPTSCAFGGKDLTTLFVTSARTRLSQSQLEHAPLSGGVFAIETQFRGVDVASYSG